MESKECYKCKIPKPLKEFYKTNGKPISVCKVCHSVRDKQYYQKSKEVVKQKSRAYYAAHRSQYQSYNKEYYAKTENKLRAFERSRVLRIESYGITVDDYNRMFAEQAGLCGICIKPFKRSPHIDHDHATGQVRGLLCTACNRTLGIFEKNKEGILKYLSIPEKVEIIPDSLEFSAPEPHYQTA